MKVFEDLRTLPGFPQVLDSGRIDDKLWMVMDLLGPSLRSVHDRYKFDEDLVLFVGIQMLERLQVCLSCPLSCIYGLLVWLRRGGIFLLYTNFNAVTRFCSGRAYYLFSVVLPLEPTRKRSRCVVPRLLFKTICVLSCFAGRYKFVTAFDSAAATLLF